MMLNTGSSGIAVVKGYFHGKSQCSKLLASATFLLYGGIAMEYITIFGDIHANLPAYEAVIEDMDQRESGNRYCLGDLVGYGVSPNEVIQAIRESGVPTIMGNYDQGIGYSSDECGCAYRDEVSKMLGKRRSRGPTSTRPLKTRLSCGDY
jgi:hypothetical protein